ncbi:MAG: cytochrome c3 family protein [Desulfuromonadales bacterium]|nr:cytochrome c3 family protein [Desulfuromonadales bacterium]
MYKGFLVDRNLLSTDPHFSQGCGFCHMGDEKGASKADAHRGLVKKPSDDLKICGRCHDQIAANYGKSLHYTTAGLKHGIRGRLSTAEESLFNEKVFPKSCNNCHATCGDCHVKSPTIGGVNPGLIQQHQFVKRNEGKTCALCHGGRVYPEFTGEYGGTPDVHYQKGMTCIDCHTRKEAHGDGSTVTSRKQVADRPACLGCHPRGSDKSDKSRAAHDQHAGKLSCVACHAAGQYRNCYDCHLGAGATAKPGFILGLDPRERKLVTTLRVIPTVRDTFSKAGVAMENYDALPNYWDTVPHMIKKRTDRTRSCEVCHTERQGFLSKETLLKGGSKANEGLIRMPPQLP